MRLAISNISWGRRLDAELLAFLRDAGCTGVELAPGLVDWVQDPPDVVRRRLVAAGLEAVAFHALLFEHPEWRLVAPAHQPAILETLRRLAAQCAATGGKFMVFGSPNSRRTETVPPEVAWSAAVDFFRRAGDTCAPLGVSLLIEPLPEAEIAGSSAEGLRLVMDVAHPAVQLHLDVRTLVKLGEDPRDVIPMQSRWLRHVHTGGPALGFIGPRDGIDHQVVARALSRTGFAGFVSLEMVRERQDPDFAQLKAAIEYAHSQYCSGSTGSGRGCDQ